MHSRQRPLSPDIEQVWLAVLADAGIDASQALLWTFPGSKSEREGWGAVYWTRGLDVCDEGSDLSAVLSNVNDPKCIRAIRVGVWTDRTLEGTAALLRHELEHAQQFALHPNLPTLCEIAEDVVRLATDSGRLYNAIPTEVDANAVAAVFVRSRYGDERIDALVSADDADVAVLRRPEANSSGADLPERMLQFLAANPALCAQLASKWGGADDPVSTFRRTLDQHAWKGAGSRWQGLLTAPPAQARDQRS